MSRLQKKCLIASSALHGLLALIFLVGTAFLVKEEEPVDQTVLSFVPDQLVDAAMQRAAGAPAPATQPPAQPIQAPPATPPAVKQPEPVAKLKPVDPEPPKTQDKPKPAKIEPEPVPEPLKADPNKVDDTALKQRKPKTPAATPKPSRPPVKVDLTQTVVRSNADTEKARKDAEAVRSAEAAKANAARIASALGKFEATTSKLTSDNIGVSAFGDGTIGVSYASFEAWVQKTYWEAWRPPNDLAAGRSIVKVKVVIRKDGTIDSASVSEPSGNSKLDGNIRQLLARVKTIGKPFPDGAKEDKRTYTIEFNLEAKLGSG